MLLQKASFLTIDDLLSRKALILSGLWLCPFDRYPERDDAAGGISNRADKIRAALIENLAKLASKKNLIGKAWPDTFVGEFNVPIDMLGLPNIPRRSCRVVMPVSLVSGASGVRDSRPLKTALPRWIIGRDNGTSGVTARLLEHRFATTVRAEVVGKPAAILSRNIASDASLVRASAVVRSQPSSVQGGAPGTATGCR